MRRSTGLCRLAVLFRCRPNRFETLTEHVGREIAVHRPYSQHRGLPPEEQLGRVHSGCRSRCHAAWIEAFVADAHIASLHLIAPSPLEKTPVAGVRFPEEKKNGSLRTI